MAYSAATVFLASGLGVFFAVIARDTLGGRPIHAVSGSHVFALLCIVTGFVQQRMGRADRWGSILSWLYIVGLGSHVVLNDWSWSNPTEDPGEWRWQAAYVPIGFMAIPLLGVAMGVVGKLGGGELASRIYIVGGLLVCTAYLAILIVTGILSLAVGGLAGFAIATFWFPMAMVLAMGSVCFGLLPTTIRPGTNVAVSYVVGAALLSLGVSWAVNVSQVPSGTQFLMLVGLVLMGPSFFVTILRLLKRRAEV